MDEAFPRWHPIGGAGVGQAVGDEEHEKERGESGAVARQERSRHESDGQGAGERRRAEETPGELQGGKER